MKTVTICRSMKFIDEMKKIAFELEGIKGCKKHQKEIVFYSNDKKEMF